MAAAMRKPTTAAEECRDASGLSLFEAAFADGGPLTRDLCASEDPRYKPNLRGLDLDHPIRELE